MPQTDPLSDHAFIDSLRAAIERYLNAVDQWEAAYQKYYRLPTFGSPVSDDLQSEQREYDRRRRELEEMLPRARRLCLKHRLSEPFSGLLRISLGQYAPQQRLDSAISRSERSAVTLCLVELNEACKEWEPGEADSPQRRGIPLLRRLVNYFY